ncbi:MAG TPA: 30S ribosomal protein S16 [Vitreimonas sp.]|nr:30S ribosomal protein S16 [Vitreimonas sp.]
MLKVKLARFGKKKQPHYRIVVNEARDKRDGSYVALLGHYAPTQTPKTLTLDVEAYNEWLKKGAQPTETVASLAARYQSGNPFPAKKAQLSKKAKAKVAAEKEAQEAAAAAPAEEAAPTAAPEAEAPAEVTEAEETKPETTA